MNAKVDNLIIGLDMDGVVIDNTRSKIRFAKKFGIDLAPEQTPADAIEQLIPADALRDIRQSLYHRPDTALEADLMDGVREGLDRLKNSDVPYFLISRRSDPELARELLRKHALWPKYFSEKNAFFVLTPEDKNIKAKQLGINLYMDDQPSVLEKLTDVPKRFLMDRFGIFHNTPYQRVSSWSEFLSQAL